ncbi:hypothetical protein [Arthrobacter sp. UYCo732]|uniref:hypothetical protein n=1 Tax=Arthrobacter sp. UYCo732 TaxID=3156336 RepID=UPI0033954A5F
MTANIIDRSFGKHHLDWRLTVTSHVLIPVSGQPGRPSILQAELVHTPLSKNAVARVSVLADDFTWTVLLDLPTELWSADLDSSAEWKINEVMDAFSTALLNRAEAILNPWAS